MDGWMKRKKDMKKDTNKQTVKLRNEKSPVSVLR